MSSIPLFHPAVAAWFERSFDAPTAAQAQAWPAIQSGRNVLIAAPTGSGKTLAAFLAAIDSLVRQGLKGELKDETTSAAITGVRLTVAFAWARAKSRSARPAVRVTKTEGMPVPPTAM